MIREHGTNTGAQQHRYRGELICAECKLAELVYQRARYWDRKRGIKLRVPALGAARRLDALVAIGWTWQALADEIGVQRAYIGHIIKRKQKISRQLDEKVSTLFDRLQTIRCPTGPEYAWRRALIPPPAAWDEETIDDPDAQPAEWRRTENGSHRGADIAADVAELLSYGESMESIAVRLSMTPAALNQALFRQKKRAEASA